MVTLSRPVCSDSSWKLLLIDVGSFQGIPLSGYPASGCTRNIKVMNRDVNLDMEISGAVMGECREKVLPPPPEFQGSQGVPEYPERVSVRDETGVHRKLAGAY